MIRSMTGYGSASGLVAGMKVTIEMRSLNSKFFELNLRCPSLFREYENALRIEFSKSVERGKLDIVINIENNEIARRSTINKEIFQAYFEELKSLSQELSIDETRWVDTILKLPMVLNSDKSDVTEEHWKELQQLLSQSTEKFNVFRAEEGKVLESDLSERLKNILKLLDDIAPFEKERVGNIRNRIGKSIAELREVTNIDQNRFEQELIFYIEKLDISEEKIRLRAHCDYFAEAMKGNEANGKKLNFIAQEIGREINTLGAKANDANIQRRVVEMKDELEKLKEQLANVL